MDDEDEATRKLLSEIEARKQLLANSDYLALKHADGILSDEEYADTCAQRKQWREEIDEIEAQLPTAEPAPDIPLPMD